MEKDQIGEDKHGTRHIDVRDIKYGKIDQAKINKIPNIVKKDSVDQVAGRTRCDAYKHDPQGEVFPAARHANIEHDQGD